MLLGAQNAWAWTKCYVTHNAALATGANAWTLRENKDEMTALGGDVYVLAVNNVGTDQVQFKITFDDTDKDWTNAIGNTTEYESEIPLSNVGGNFAFTLPAANDIKIYYAPNATNKVYVEYTTKYTVQIKLVGPASYLYVWSYETNKIEYLGGWPGNNVCTGTGTSSDPYVYTLTNMVPKNYPLNIKFNNNSGKEAPKIETGVISSNMEFTFDIDANYLFWSLRGEFNNWTDLNQTSGSYNIVNLGASETKKFKIYNGDWYGNTSKPTITSTTSTATEFSNKNGSNDDVSITTTVAGDYVFRLTSWGTYPEITVMYPGASYPRTMAAEAWGTICLPYAVSTANVSAANMDFYSILGVDSKAAPTKLYLKEETELVAGKPYIFQATAADPSVTYGTTAAMVGSENGLVGTYVATSIDGSNNDDKLYVITAAGGVQRAAASCNVGANKAYIKLNDVPEGNFLAPGVRVIEMNLGANDATDISSIEANEVAHKFIENGKLFIQKNGVVYDMTGRVVR